MYEYKCEKCKGRQFSSSKEKTKEPCVYCGDTRLSLVGATEEKKSEVGKDERNVWEYVGHGR